MTTTKHTPLPWKFHQGNDYIEIYQANKKNPESIILDGVNTKRSQNNAAFIVTACNNHYALLEIVRYMANFSGRNNNKHLKEMARAALAKAEGK